MAPFVRRVEEDSDFKTPKQQSDHNRKKKKQHNERCKKPPHETPQEVLYQPGPQPEEGRCSSSSSPVARGRNNNKRQRAAVAKTGIPQSSLREFGTEAEVRLFMHVCWMASEVESCNYFELCKWLIGFCMHAFATQGYHDALCSLRAVLLQALRLGPYAGQLGSTADKFPLDPRTAAFHLQAVNHYINGLKKKARGDATVCACCNRYRPWEQLAWTPFSAIPNVQLLRADGAKTASVRRDGQTTLEYKGLTYCLQGAAGARCVIWPNQDTQQPMDVDEQTAPGTAAKARRAQSTGRVGGRRKVTPKKSEAAKAREVAEEAAQRELRVQMCQTCMASLKQNRVPKVCLATLDPGPCPSLPPLTWLESVVLAPYRALRHIITVKPKGDSRAAVACNTGLVGHVIAVPHPGPGEFLNKVFPLPMENLPELINVRITLMNCHDVSCVVGHDA